MLDKAHQLFIPGRSGEVRDVLIDAAAGDDRYIAKRLGGPVAPPALGQRYETATTSADM